VAVAVIIGKQTLHDIGAVLDFKEKTITIDDILLPMRNINNRQLKSSISRELKVNSSFAQEPTSTRNTTKCMVTGGNLTGKIPSFCGRYIASFFFLFRARSPNGRTGARERELISYSNLL
jgi:hypothetical protein